MTAALIVGFMAGAVVATLVLGAWAVRGCNRCRAALTAEEGDQR